MQNPRLWPIPPEKNLHINKIPRWSCTQLLRSASRLWKLRPRKSEECDLDVFLCGRRAKITSFPCTWLLSPDFCSVEEILFSLSPGILAVLDFLSCLDKQLTQDCPLHFSPAILCRRGWVPRGLVFDSGIRGSGQCYHEQCAIWLSCGARIQGQVRLKFFSFAHFSKLQPFVGWLQHGRRGVLN